MADTKLPALVRDLRALLLVTELLDAAAALRRRITPAQAASLGDALRTYYSEGERA